MSHSPKTWWGEEFVAALEAFIDTGRLQRGKAYRTDKRVLAFVMKQENITATVLGNASAYFGVEKAPHYKITLQFEPIPPQNWPLIIQRISENPSWLTKLMLKEMPDNIEDAFKTSSLLPSSYEDMKATCSCPDYANPCKHIAGIYYRIATMLDNDPMLLFELRGLKKEALLMALEQTEFGRVLAHHLLTQSSNEITTQPHRFSAFETNEGVQCLSKDAIWTMTPIENKEYTEEIPMSATLIKKQGEYPAFWQEQRSFIMVMEEVYKTVKRKNAKQLFSK